MQSEYMIYPIGSNVLVKHIDVYGVITEIILDSYGARYVVSYFVRGQHVVEVFRDIEFEAEEDPLRCWILSKNN